MGIEGKSPAGEEIQVLQDALQKEKKLRLQLLRSVISLRDTLLIQKGFAKRQPNYEESAVYQSICSLDAQILELMEDNQIHVIAAEEGAFDETQQVIVGVNETDDPQQARKIAAVSRPGYRIAEGLLRPEEVYVYRYKE